MSNKLLRLSLLAAVVIFVVPALAQRHFNMGIGDQKNQTKDTAAVSLPAPAPAPVWVIIDTSGRVLSEKFDTIVVRIQVRNVKQAIRPLDKNNPQDSAAYNQGCRAARFDATRTVVVQTYINKDIYGKWSKVQTGPTVLREDTTNTPIPPAKY
ncbi:MAG: hypothetical protein PHE24_03800 [Patescibacteria group bacterium]|nr:hypothetical protein [Patescibacteria group bacterium]